jgi:uncharacterized protein YycO
MTRLKLGQVVLTEGSTRWISLIIKRVTGSKFTHAFIYVGNNKIVEVWFPKCRTYALDKRMAELKAGNREHILLDLPGITLMQRVRVARQAYSYRNRWYNVSDVLVYLFLGRFFADKGRNLFCSRLAAAAFYSGIGVSIFTEEILNKKLPVPYRRAQYKNLLEGYPVPHELLYSKLEKPNMRWL